MVTRVLLVTTAGHPTPYAVQHPPTPTFDNTPVSATTVPYQRRTPAPGRCSDVAAPATKSYTVGWQPLIGQRQTRRCFPTNITTQPPDALPDQTALPTPVHTNTVATTDAGNRRATIRPPEQVPDINPSGNYPPPMLSQPTGKPTPLEPDHHLHRQRIQQLPINNVHPRQHPPYKPIPKRQLTTRNTAFPTTINSPPE